MSQELTVSDDRCSFLVQNELLKTDFEMGVTEAIDEIFLSFGNVVKPAIYHHLENSYGIKKEEIPFKIEDFAEALEQTFGSVAKLIEIKIIERLHAKHKDFFYVPKKGELNFVEFVSNLQNYLESQV
jgi:hypothetical protein